MSGVHLVWDGKDAPPPRPPLPLQVVETVGDRDDTWRNTLVRGDNLHVLHSLAGELAGRVDLVYIDPPFRSRQDHSVRVGVGDGPGRGAIERTAYRDTWAGGVESYLQMLYQRLVAIRELLSERGTLYLHLGKATAPYARPLLDELFGPEHYVDELTWKRSHAHGDAGQGARHFGRVSESIFVYRRGDAAIWHPQYADYTDERLARDYKYAEPDGRVYRLVPVDGPGGAAKGNPYYEFLGVPGHWRYSRSRMQELYDAGQIVLSSTGRSLSRKKYLDEAKGTPVTDLWDDVDRLSPTSRERLGYATQKPEALLERIVRASSDEDSIVLDCFAGSGTTPAVAEKLGRRWIAVDASRSAIHTTRKRLLDIPAAAPFAVATLGHHERREWWSTTGGRDAVVALHRAALGDGVHVDGAVHVGAVDAPVGRAEITTALDAAVAAGHPVLDVLGWAFDQGLHGLVAEARGRGVRLRLRTIPDDVMDERAVASGEVTFPELASIEVRTEVTGATLTVTLTGFEVGGPARTTVSSWRDYVDYWAVDFDHRGEAFHNRWRSFRTRADRSLALQTAHDYDEPGTYTVAVTVVDVFGDEATLAREVTVGLTSPDDRSGAG